MGEVKLARVDSRLAHGRVVEMWTKELGVKRVIIANDEVSCDDFKKKVMDLTIPEGIEVSYLMIYDVADFLKTSEEDVFLLVQNPKDLEKISTSGINLDQINVGIIHMSPGKKSLTEEVAVDEDDLRIFKEFLKQGSSVYLRLSPFSQKMDITSLFNRK